VIADEAVSGRHALLHVEQDPYFDGLPLLRPTALPCSPGKSFTALISRGNHPPACGTSRATDLQAADGTGQARLAGRVSVAEAARA
jgi:hypothetical protein